ncbi:MAG: L-ribulose-5-phosphate 4-epimerase AraD [bacterium]
MGSIQELKKRAWKNNLALAKSGLTPLTFGNVSAIDRNEGIFAIKPSGVPYNEIDVDDMVVLDLNLRLIDGKLRPSSDTKTHAVLYRDFPEIGGVAHAHAPNAVAWAQAMKPIPILGTTHADLAAMDIPCTRVMSDEMIKGDYEEETGNLIVQRFSNLSYQDMPMVLVACHGPFAWGASPEKAVEHCLLLEEIAKIALMTLIIDGSTPRLKQTLIDKHYNRKHGTNAYYGQKKRR